jgi:hypothetical protein
LARVFDDEGLEAQAKPRDAEMTKELRAKIGQLVVELDFLPKARDR